MPSFFYNGEEVSFQEGDNILQAILRTGKEIPHFCYHEALTPAATCRMCMVDIQDAGNGRPIPKLQTSCSTPAQEGMKVVTASKKVEKARESVMEFLLFNHPLDCVICDQAGECKLQDYSFKHGTGKSVMDSEKRVYGNRSIGSYLELERNRCIHCTRCVRFTQEVTGTNEMGAFNRSNELTVDTFVDSPLTDNFQGNLADICPVGAITTKDFRFQKRVWFGKHTDSICAGCSRGCNVKVHHEKDKIFRFVAKTNPNVNKWWICDSGRTSFHSYLDLKNRQLVPKVDDKKVSLSFCYKKVRSILEGAEKDQKEVGIFLSPHLSNEEVFVAKKFFSRELSKSTFFTSQSPKEEGINKDKNFIHQLVRLDKAPNRMGLTLQGVKPLKGELRKFSTLFVLGATNDELNALEISEETELILVTSWFSALTKSTVTLPLKSYFEKTGSYTNFESVLQEAKAIIPPVGSSQSLIELLVNLIQTDNGFNIPKSQHQALQGLAEEVKTFSPVLEKKIPELGLNLK